MNFAFWNVRGIVDPVRQFDVRNFIRSNNICYIGLMETKMSGWEWIFNYEYSTRGRIWVGWSSNLVNFIVHYTNGQIIYGLLNHLISGKSLFLSAIYGNHTFVARRPLWDDLVRLSGLLSDSPWIVASNFNAIRDPFDRLGSPDIWIPAFDEFKDCLGCAELEDLRSVGFKYTWSSYSGD
ncbi:hypothetical protein BT93_L2406 [Corymbia citriodora subsp. variegata]|uniref:Endonuclease/exonuclease/phosphatase domain-containing protein n=1 Tax=Corymbia citriodora subsp. variegata TaxID=360336 RepID=A0A8T0CMF3_CORYI|nr:hypothetical protein BT93_L2406 [Corymbia citriodora subsp. variegata]